MSDDYVMRQVRGIAGVLSHLLLGKEEERESIRWQAHISMEDRSLLTTLRFLMNVGQIGEAEHLLFEELERGSSSGLSEVAETFYRWLSELDDQTLVRGGFSREEIAQGYGDAMALLGKNKDRQSIHADGLLPDEEEKAKEK